MGTGLRVGSGVDWEKAAAQVKAVADGMASGFDEAGRQLAGSVEAVRDSLGDVFTPGHLMRLRLYDQLQLATQIPNGTSPIFATGGNMPSQSQPTKEVWNGYDYGCTAYDCDWRFVELSRLEEHARDTGHMMRVTECRHMALPWWTHCGQCGKARDREVIGPIPGT